MRVPTWSLLCSLLVAKLPHGEAVTSIVLHPTKTATTEAALIVVPGASISGEAYRPLGMAHIHTMSGKHSAGVSPKAVGGSADGLPPQHTQPPRATWCHQFRPRHASPAGHDVQQHLRRWSQLGSKYKGILLFASYLTRDMPLATYPLPVLTISGDLDGQTRITRIADEFELLREKGNEGGVYRCHHQRYLDQFLLLLQAARGHGGQNRSHVYSTPVIVMRGVNHAQFASGAMPKQVVTHDLTPEVTSQAAYTLIAKHTSAFLVATLRAPQAALAQARADWMQPTATP
ncbi:hypothetical protein C0Q70_05368 [Pomacea canaliculata]|uniref:Uncharacterized protein n=1 Tax=Pomacea canaliculata TaxID=400727 RepID=A0A2T7PKZ5_POMCA|nr:hypothetical protein C0Q70_05368 [Pomacea canaliculata]